MNSSRVLFSFLILEAALWAQPTPAPAPPPPPARPRAMVIRSSGGSFLGIGVAEVDAERAKALNLKEERGVEVKNVEEDSPAAKGGIKVGDVVLEYNSQRVEGIEQFIRLVRETPAGRQSRLLIFRNGATQTATVATGSRSSRGRSFDFDDAFEFEMPSIPDVRIPDLPKALMSWKSTTLGIESESLGSQLAEYFGVKEGVLVRSVAKDSPASKAGLKAGDIIVKVDDVKVTAPRELSDALRSGRSKKSATLSVVRNRSEMNLKVPLEDSSYFRGERFRATTVRFRSQLL